MRRRVPRRGRAVATLLAAACTPLVTGCSGSSTSAGTMSFDLPALHGPGHVRLADFRGRPTVVNFFASWCTACNEELPDFVKAATALKGKVNFVGVNSLETGDKDLLPERYHLTTVFQALASDLGGKDGKDGNRLHAALGGSKQMPLTAFYDAKGRLLDVEHVALYPDGTLAKAISTLYGLTA